MLRSVPMVHFRAQVPGRDAAPATRAIAAAGLLHLVDIAHGRTSFDASPPGVRELYASFRDIVHRIRAVSDRLGVARKEPEGALDATDTSDFAAERERILLVLEPIEKRVAELARKLAEARERATVVAEALENAARLRRAGLDVERLVSLRFATLRLGIAPAETLASISSILAPGPHAVVALDEQPDGVLFAAVSPSRGRIDEALRLVSAQPVALPRGGDGLDPQALQQAQNAAAQAQRDLDDERAASAEPLAGIARRAEVSMLLLQAETFFAAAGRFIVISGWVPEESAEKLKERVRSATEGRAVVEIEAAESVPGFAEGTLRVPILHHNPLLLRPFQKLVDIYGTPSYAEVEPTAFFALGFLAMFGLMFGDVGHGAVLFSAGWLLYRYMPRFLDYGILLMEAGTASALFGVLYGSVFGITGLLPALWLEPIHDLQRFMFIAIGLGIVVVTAGLVLNIINTWRSGDLKEALIGPKGIAGALLYWVVIVLLARAFVPATAVIPSWVIFVLLGGAVLLMIGAGPIAKRLGRTRAPTVHGATPWWLRALEASVDLVDTLFSFFANTISFVRIAAFAAVHCAIFLAIFAIAETMSASFSILIHIAGNVVVILLEGLTVSVQVLRLEYYEFFGKFFRGGGEPYVPLTLRPRSEQHA